MAAGRIYDVPFSKSTTYGVQDLVLIEVPSSMAIEILAVTLGPVEGLTTTQNVSIAQRKYASGYTPGSGGASVTPGKRLKGDAASVTTCLVNNTTVTSGTIEDSVDDVWNQINGYQWWAQPDTEITCEPSTAYVLSLLTAMATTGPISGTVTIREIL